MKINCREARHQGSVIHFGFDITAEGCCDFFFFFSLAVILFSLTVLYCRMAGGASQLQSRCHLKAGVGCFFFCCPSPSQNQIRWCFTYPWDTFLVFLLTPSQHDLPPFILKDCWLVRSYSDQLRIIEVGKKNSILRDFRFNTTAGLFTNVITLIQCYLCWNSALLDIKPAKTLNSWLFLMYHEQFQIFKHQISQGIFAFLTFFSRKAANCVESLWKGCQNHRNTIGLAQQWLHCQDVFLLVVHI